MYNTGIYSSIHMYETAIKWKRVHEFEKEEG